MTASATHLVLIPSYNTGAALLLGTVRAARRAWMPVWVVIDGSTDGSDRAIRDEATRDPGLRVLVEKRNRGKGGALHAGLRAAQAAGFTHALTFDADGQHPADHIGAFMTASHAAPEAAVFGIPRFAPDAPGLRVHGRKVSNWWVRLETGGRVRDSLFGFRVYPIASLLAAFERTRFMRRFDFDPEAAVRLCWAGVPVISLAAPVFYPDSAADRVSHFRYGRDNAALTFMHVRLMLALVLRGGRRRRAPRRR